MPIPDDEGNTHDHANLEVDPVDLTEEEAGEREGLRQDASVRSVPKNCLSEFQTAATCILNVMSEAMATGNQELIASSYKGFNSLPLLTISSNGKDQTAAVMKMTLNAVINSMEPHVTASTLAIAARRSRAIRQDAAKSARQAITATTATEEDSRLKYCKKRCSALVKVGRLSDAVSTLRGHLEGNSIVTPMGGSTPCFREAFDRLHPPSSEEDLMFRPPGLTLLPPGLQLEPDLVMREFSKFPKLSAGGMSCWTLDLMSQIAGDDITVATAFTNVYNMILSGRGGDAGLWTLCRLIFLVKPDGKPRPIAMTDCFPRGLGRIVAAAMAKKLGHE
jgi:hypothetical protein